MRFDILDFFVHLFILHTDVSNEHCYFQDLLHYLPLLYSLLHRIIEMNNNSPPLTFKRFETIVSRLELPRRPLPPITRQQMDKCCTKIADNHDQLYSIPSLEELGMIVFPFCTFCSCSYLRPVGTRYLNLFSWYAGDIQESRCDYVYQWLLWFDK